MIKTQSIPNVTLIDGLRMMLRIRFHEEAIKELYQQGSIGGTTHLCIGQEAVSAGVISQLRRDDYIVSTHRGHGHMLAKGGQLRPMIAEILGKYTGYCKGKGGSMHIASLELGNLGANGIVSGGLPIAVGAALSAKMRGTDQITLVAFGDGATSEGNTHESMNLAAIWNLPVLFLFENNQYAVSTQCNSAVAGANVVGRAAAYGIDGLSVDGNDFEAVYLAGQQAISQVRDHPAPFLLECKTYRIEGHYYGDPMAYRTQSEVDEWRQKDPILCLESRLIECGVISIAQSQEIRLEIKAEVDDAVRFAESSPEPPLESIYDDVYTGSLQ